MEFNTLKNAFAAFNFPVVWRKKAEKQKSEHRVLLSGLIVILASYFSPLNAAVTFQKLNGPFKNAVESWGASWADVNNDAYPDLFVGNHRALPTFYMNNTNGNFTNSTAFVDVGRTWFDTPLLDHHGSSFADFDNDGDQDLFLSTAYAYDAQIMVNSGNGQLINRIGNYPAMRVDQEGRLPVWFDYNRDGKMDMAMSNGAKNTFYAQAGNGTFSNKTAAANFVSDLTTFGILWDVNGDNTLDLVMANDGPFPEVAYSTNGLPFTNITGLIPPVQSVLDALQGDFDRDLRNDVFLVRGALRHRQVKQVSNTRLEARMHMDAGSSDKGFEFTTAGTVTLKIDSTQYSSAFRAFTGANGVHLPDQDGTPDNKITTLILDPSNPQTHGIDPNRNKQGTFIGYTPATKKWTVRIGLGSSGPPPASRAYFIATSTSAITNVSSNSITSRDKQTPGVMLLSKQNGIVNSTASTGALANPVSCISGAAADFDNDMDMDIYLVCSGGVENISNIMFENNGSGVFTKHVNAWGAVSAVGVGLPSGAGTGENATVADYNLDGFVDIHVTNGLNLRPFLVGGPNHLYRNQGNNNKWVQFDLQGTASTRDGIGARVIVTAGGISQLREQNGGYKRWAQNDRRLHFGLANNGTANVQVQWPSGIVSNFTNVAANKIYRIVEGGGIQVVVPGAGGGGGGNTTPVFVISDASRSEDGGSMTFTVTASPAPTSQISVNYATVTNTAISGTDFTATSGTLNFFSGDTSKNITVNILNDNLAEADEDFTVTLTNAVDALIGDGQGTGTIIDDDSGGGGQSGLSINDNAITEGAAGAVKFTVTLTPTPTAKVTVKYATVNGTALAGSDYSAKNGTLTFFAGQTTKNVWVGVKNDSVAEDEETFILRLSNPTNATIAKADGITTITDDETGGGGGGQSGLSINDNAITEGAAGAVKFTVTLTPAPTSKVTVKYATVNGTALAGSDYSAKNGTLTFFAGQTTKNVWVGVKNDSVAEDEETFILQLSNPTNATIAKADGITTITDDETGGGGGGQSGLSINDNAITEGAAGAVKFTVTLTPAPTSKVTVKYATVNGTALAGSDYSAKNGTLTFFAGQTTKNVWVGVKNDSVAEDEETFILRLSNPTNATIAKADGITTITDDETGGGGGGQSGLSINDNSITEGAAGAVKFTVTLTPAPTAQVTVKYATVNGSALAGSDYSAKNGTLTFNAGQTTKNVWVGVKDDSQAESTENFTLRLSNPTNAAISKADGVTTITDDDSGGGGGSGSALSINNTSKKEGTGGAKLTITLSPASSAQVKVKFKTVNGSAVAGSDYTYKAGTLTFNAGETQKNIWVPIKSDSVNDPNETFTVRLTNPVNATIADNSGTVTILE